MKAKIVIFAVLVIAITTIAVPFFRQLKNTFEFFTKIENSKRSVPYPLNSNKLSLLNIRTNENTYLKLNGITIINFWASWCKPCIEEEASLEALSKRYKNVNFILLSFDSLDAQIKVIKENKWTLPAYFCSDTNIITKPYILPTTLFIKDSVVYKEVYGAKNWLDESLMYKVDSLIENLSKKKALLQ